jgi:hypothetical protein
MSDTASILSYKDAVRRRERQAWLLADCIKLLKSRVKELGAYRDLDGVDDAVEMLTALQSDLSDQLQDYL